jgi:hypothetical protein
MRLQKQHAIAAAVIVGVVFQSRNVIFSLINNENS